MTETLSVIYETCFDTKKVESTNRSKKHYLIYLQLADLLTPQLLIGECGMVGRSNIKEKPAKKRDKRIRFIDQTTIVESCLILPSSVF